MSDGTPHSRTRKAGSGSVDLARWIAFGAALSVAAALFVVPLTLNRESPGAVRAQAELPTNTPGPLKTLEDTKTPTPTATPIPGVTIIPPVPWHGELCAGWRQRYTLTYINDTGIPQTNVELIDIIPDVWLDVLLDESSPGGVYDGVREVKWNLGTVAPGEEVTRYLELRIWAQVPSGIIQNCVTARSDQSPLLPLHCAESLILQCTPEATRTYTPTLTPVPTETATPTTEPTVPTPSGLVLHLPLVYNN